MRRQEPHRRGIHADMGGQCGIEGTKETAGTACLQIGRKAANCLSGPWQDSRVARTEAQQESGRTGRCALPGGLGSGKKKLQGNKGW